MANTNSFHALLRGITVLVVEDDHDLRDVLSITLQHAGARPVVAGTASAALSTLATVRCHVVITDLTLPDHDGRWLLEQVRQAHGALPVIAMTGYPPPAGETHGFDRWLLKPVDPAPLCEEIAGLLGRPRP